MGHPRLEFCLRKSKSPFRKKRDKGGAPSRMGKVRNSLRPL